MKADPAQSLGIKNYLEEATKKHPDGTDEMQQKIALICANPYRELQKKLLKLEDERRADLLTLVTGKQ